MNDDELTGSEKGFLLSRLDMHNLDDFDEGFYRMIEVTEDPLLKFNPRVRRALARFITQNMEKFSSQAEASLFLEGLGRGLVIGQEFRGDLF